jgi:hypothetical protein
MMTLTTAVELPDSPRAPGWFYIECDLCGYRTWDGSLPVCEDQAEDHLTECHPRRHDRAHRETRLQWLTYQALRQAENHPQDEYLVGA